MESDEDALRMSREEYLDELVKTTEGGAVLFNEASIMTPERHAEMARRLTKLTPYRMQKAHRQASTGV